MTLISNVDLKMISKTLSEKLKKVLPDLLSSQQTAYVENRHIGESERLISDVTEISKIKKLEGFLFAMDIVKAFDSLDHNFLIPTPAKYGFDKYFILWVKILLRDQEIRSCLLFTAIQLQNISHLGEVTVKLTQFQLFIYFSFRNLMSSYKIKT